ncbi:hypothetical protein V4E86_19565 [Burkholderia pseudomallei]|uniref:Uncharacterized protein n=1 Tax=Burkholderia pseudomallei 1710a TaxID=320371 RepID=A0A0E1VVH4_BURPE|nr:hypothetical protein [Burkholderia pseudomallei]EDS82060.1 hypothetical protein BURPSS13_0174 [Burkholderia pseudomallei S13]EET04001.1 hypothetical protein BURPS1710A_A2357 [Burkholderia pseudomallei 1710a]ARL41567.1 hypothetical protein BOC49_25315 [Burkholderia pseudomallei]ARL55030.1 hypothetical protein BOC51_25335 [Burkholderia pseudomallei]EDO83540.1 hypothetical protein BURPS406E_0460 [Burkholderia pseudomallei 406e]
MRFGCKHVRSCYDASRGASATRAARFVLVDTASHPRSHGARKRAPLRMLRVQWRVARQAACRRPSDARDAFA